MTNRISRATALLSALALVAVSGVAFAADPTQSDFDTCNREAQLSAGTPAASPGTSGSTGGGVSGGTPGGSVSGGVTTPDTSGGTTGGTTGSSADEALLRGMSAQGQSDAAFQQAFLDCMHRRGF